MLTFDFNDLLDSFLEDVINATSLRDRVIKLHSAYVGDAMDMTELSDIQIHAYRSTLMREIKTSCVNLYDVRRVAGGMCECLDDFEAFSAWLDQAMEFE